MTLLHGRRALVTGASAGLGFAIARELAMRGAGVLMASRSAERIAEAARGIAAELRGADPLPGGAVPRAPVPIAADVTAASAAGDLARAARDSLGGLDILVCNAGGPPPGDFADLGDAAWEEAFRLILLAPIRLIRACLLLLRESGAGRIVLCSSMSGVQPVARLMLSNVLRPGLMGMAKHLGGELAADGILVNAVAPGYFATGRSREVMEAIAARRGRSWEDVERERVAEIPVARQGEPVELGRLVAFLVSTDNSYLTGQTIVIDGGLITAP
ncbi:MAG: SDR family oxidoreductase [Candidatus Eisenbacteria bacterium]|uniref:SDR family oxidoreductase n=1 Tax=Eiseniibacteriota bacterium TaxID=2212470 RepID=A0A938BRE7_UNCEI|nr:SDR family oxidoreductase [Candidatus Eisenbacteria bacterium]